jgi:hypothetical protein
MRIRCVEQSHRGLFYALLVAACCGAFAGCDAPRTAWAEPTPGTASSSSRSAVLDAAAPARVNNPTELKKVSRTPPKLPYSRRLVCNKDSDCAIVPPRPCMCPVCGTAWHEVLSKRELKKLEAMWAKERCVRHVCPNCEGRLLGTKAVCRSRQCAVE